MWGGGRESLLARNDMIEDLGWFGSSTKARSPAISTVEARYIRPFEELGERSSLCRFFFFVFFFFFPPFLGTAEVYYF